MAGPALSKEGGQRRSLRLTLGVSLTFLLVQFLNWPLAFVAPLFTTILLIDAEPVSPRRAAAILGSAAIGLASGYIIALSLLPYPAVLVLAACFLTYSFFMFALRSGAHLLVIIGTLLSLILVPVVVKLLPELAPIVITGILINLIVALLSAWIAFFLMPAPAPPADAHHHGPIDAKTATTLAGSMTIVTAPLLTGFLLFGWTSILVLVYGVLLATALSSEAGAEMGWDKVVANLIFGGGGMLLFNETMVAAPNVLVLIALTFLVIFTFANRIFSGTPSAAFWLSGFFGFLILINSVMLSDKVVPSAKAIDRVIQIGIGSIYVVFAYRIVELARFLFSRHR